MHPPIRSTKARTERRGVVLALLSAGLAGASLRSLAAGPFDLAALTALLQRVKSGEATFTETRRIEMLDRTLASSGRLSFRSPDVFVRETLRPRREKLAVEGNTLTMSFGDRSRTMQLDASPEAAVIVEAVRGTLTGNRESLERLFATTVSGGPEAWTLELVPRDARLRGQVASVRVAGRESVVREVQVLLADGDRSVMTITPLSPGRGPS
ncbi:MAG TPA: outer membrane lipoprotein carrier protein LolA [Caldimonas sp.]|jgi:outer membrane lipoprotein-sorting protein|nr:outer membrane lipoprotein carrier protein LolA [Caldimonas sp.]HEX2539738.1 outer membrane lipoprotein carrier protein LolA [Caldimonas sp.]